MTAGAIHRKTDKGAAEVTDRKLRVNPRLRAMLILIDGTRPEFLVREEAQKVGAPADFLEQLTALGPIEKMKLERASTRADLRELASAYRSALEKAVGAAEAEVLAGRLDALLR